MGRQVNIEELFGGIPMVNCDFKTERVLAAVVVSRINALKNLNQKSDSNDYKNLLSPNVARKIRELESKIPDEIQFEKMPDEYLYQIQIVLKEINKNYPGYEKYFKIPYSFKLLKDEKVISCSSYNFPQHIFLGKKAFKTKSELTEQILHEIAHNWMYFFEELFKLQDKNLYKKYTLPSGTSNKLLKEVLGAAHVSAVICNYYKSISTKDEFYHRIIYLEQYLNGCFSILDAKLDDLSPQGVHILIKLKNLFKNK